MPGYGNRRINKTWYLIRYQESIHEMNYIQVEISRMKRLAFSRSLGASTEDAGKHGPPTDLPIWEGSAITWINRVFNPVTTSGLYGAPLFVNGQEKILGGIDIKLTIFMTGYHDDTYEDKEYGVTSAARRDDGDGPDANGGPTRAKWRKSECGDRDVPRKGSANEPTQLSAASKTRREAGGTLDECAELGRSGLEVDGDEVDVARGRRRTDVGAL
ncbi:hypothetical protein FB451DRAFT_1360356 [Mycena latifolia]|nr:hypothetical protein FB451DRAFT_1360356 [Mycena latifolia]